MFDPGQMTFWSPSPWFPPPPSTPSKHTPQFPQYLHSAVNQCPFWLLLPQFTQQWISAISDYYYPSSLSSESVPFLVTTAPVRSAVNQCPFWLLLPQFTQQWISAISDYYYPSSLSSESVPFLVTTAPVHSAVNWYLQWYQNILTLNCLPCQILRKLHIFVTVTHSNTVYPRHFSRCFSITMNQLNGYICSMNYIVTCTLHWSHAI